VSTVRKESFAQATPGTESRRRVVERIHDLGLEANVADLELNGYTVVENAAPLELFDRISQAILDVTAATLARGVTPFDFGPNTTMMYRLLAHDDVFAEAIIVPKLEALLCYLLGEGYVLTVATGSVLSEGARPGPIHADNQFFPDPFPPQFQVATAIWCCDDFSEAYGSTHLVPGSHRRLRHPTTGEGRNEAVAVEAPRGSIVIWTGHTWHRSGGRDKAGQRVALHTGFARPHLRVFESYEPEVVERLTAKDQRFVRLLGADLPWEYQGDSPDLMKLLALAATTQAQA